MVTLQTIMKKENMRYKCGQRRLKSYLFSCSSARALKMKLLSVTDRKLLKQSEIGLRPRPGLSGVEPNSDNIYTLLAIIASSVVLSNIYTSFYTVSIRNQNGQPEPPIGPRPRSLQTT